MLGTVEPLKSKTVFVFAYSLVTESNKKVVAPYFSPSLDEAPNK
ncbi:hypothetical protein PI23P_00760 [Polaribacter irgensii 23-P]|uniref:Uncharacterized protein n=1 Tax=Polaribacter irgensii 23-P TaxID=313594 RepID=A4C289_9FLAO|nr:hypothetical protein PI23P_00760 [Polaribacter irgensii 23-P]